MSKVRLANLRAGSSQLAFIHGNTAVMGDKTILAEGELDLNRDNRIRDFINPKETHQLG